MEFHGSGYPATENGFVAASGIIGVDEPAFWALMNVETRGVGFLASRRPVILFERHVFHRLTGGKFDEAHPAISSPLPGGYAGGAAEYLRLNSAMILDADAALQSTSWGIGQLMGFNFALAGFASVQEMVTAMVRDENTQLMALARFLVAAKLAADLRLHEWDEFACAYNGVAYEHNAYDVKLAAAYDRYATDCPDIEVRAVQVALLYLGCNPGAIDGVIGPRTRAAVVAFQRKRRMVVDGELDLGMADMLMATAFPS